MYAPHATPSLGARNGTPPFGPGVLGRVVCVSPENGEWYAMAIGLEARDICARHDR